MGTKKLNLYIIHAAKLHERRKVIDELRKILGKYNFSRLKINEITVIWTNDPEEITNEVLQKNVNYTPIDTQDENLKVYNSLIRVLHLNNVSNALKHYDALNMISKCEDTDVVHLILEDDVMFEPRMCMLLDKTIDKLAEQDIVFLGMPNNESVPNTNKVELKNCKDVFRILPYNDSYVISQKLASQLVSRFLPIKFYTSIHLSYLLDTTEGITAKQTVPNLFADGSKFGMFLSSQTANNDLVFNREYMFIKSLLSKPPAEITADEKTIVAKIMKESSIVNNPDFMALAGKYYREVYKDYNKTLELYQKAFDAYQKNGAIINNESLFLRDFINLHAHIQPDLV